MKIAVNIWTRTVESGVKHNTQKPCFSFQYVKNFTDILVLFVEKL